MPVVMKAVNVTMEANVKSVQYFQCLKKKHQTIKDKYILQYNFYYSAFLLQTQMQIPKALKQIVKQA